MQLRSKTTDHSKRILYVPPKNNALYDFFDSLGNVYSITISKTHSFADSSARILVRLVDLKRGANLSITWCIPEGQAFAPSPKLSADLERKICHKVMWIPKESDTKIFPITSVSEKFKEAVSSKRRKLS